MRNTAHTIIIQATAKYNGDCVTIIDSYKESMLIISSHNPIETVWVNIAELDSITWIIDSKCA